MTLDRLQEKLYRLQKVPKKKLDFMNGWCLRFADDIVILAKTQSDAFRFKKELEKFIEKRGLELSKEKTKIVNIKDGFDFLGYFYSKNNGILKTKPNSKSINNFLNGIEEYIFNSNIKHSQKSLIVGLNAKINGWAMYQRITDAKEIFYKIDKYIFVLLLKYMKEIYPEKSQNKLLQKYFIKINDNKYVFALPSNPKIRIVTLEDIVLIKPRCIDLKKNIFLDKEYFIFNEEDIKVNNVVDRYKKVWDKQEGKCAICNKKILDYQNRKIIYKKLNKRKDIHNMLYIHSECENSELYIVKTNDFCNILEKMEKVVDDIKNINISKRNHSFDKLTAYFHNLRRAEITLKFSDIAKKIGKARLDDIAYNNTKYFLDNEPDKIGYSWFSQGFEIKNINIIEEKISFKKDTRNRPRVILPDYVFKQNIPFEAKVEIEDLLDEMKRKYRL